MLPSLHDAEIRNLRVDYDKNQQPVYILNYFLFERPAQLNLGPYEKCDVRYVRLVARKALAMASNGIDPAVNLHDPEWQKTAPSINFGRMCRLLFYSGQQYSDPPQFVATHIIPAWGHRMLEGISADDVDQMCALAERRKAQGGSQVRAFIQHVFNEAYFKGQLAEEHPHPVRLRD